MAKNFVVITKIYYGTEQLSRRRKEKAELEIWERNELIMSMFSQILNKSNKSMADIYSQISVQLKERFGITLSEDQIMRVTKDLRYQGPDSSG